MTPQDFCYWLRGYTEIVGEKTSRPTASQWASICDHLNLVFEKVTPTRNTTTIDERMIEIAGKRCGPPPMEEAEQRRLCDGKLPGKEATYCKGIPTKDDDGVLVVEHLSRTC